MSLAKTLSLFLLLFCPLLLMAQTEETNETSRFIEEQLAQIEAEAGPSALFSASLGDANVDFFLSGSWRTGIGVSLIVPLGETANSKDYLLGFVDEPWFNQAKFLLSIWYDQKFFIDLSISETEIADRFLLGYRDVKQSDGLYQWLLGNQEIGIPNYGNIPISLSADGSPGTLFSFRNSDAELHILSKIVGRNTVTEYFKGTSPQNKIIIKPENFRKGQFFVGPYQSSTSMLVYVQSDQGSLASDGNFYQLMTPEDFLYFSAEQSKFGLKKAAQGRVLLVSQNSSSANPQLFANLEVEGSFDTDNFIEFSSLNESLFASKVLRPLGSFYGWSLNPVSANPSDLLISIEGNSALIIYEQGLFSPFEDYSWYSSGGLSGQIDITTNNSIVFPSWVRFTYLQLMNAGSPNALYQRYPLIQADTSNLYLPASTNNSQFLLEALAVQGKAGTLISLSQKALEASVVVSINGLTSYAWQLDESGRNLSLSMLDARDTVVVSYQTDDRNAPSRSLQVGLSGKYALSENDQLKAGIALELPVLVNPLSQTAINGLFASGIEFEHQSIDKQLKLNVSTNFSVSIPDSTRILTIQSYGNDYYEFLSDDSITLPSALPSFGQFNTALNLGSLIAQDPSDNPGNIITSLSQTERKFAQFKTVSRNGGQLSGWRGDAELIDQTSPLQVGPYITNSENDDPFKGKVLVSTFDPSSSGNLASFELRIPFENRSLLDKTDGIEFWVLTPFADAELDLFVQIGALSEDLDEDSQLDTLNPALQGLVLNNPEWSESILVKNNARNVLEKGEDRNANTILDNEKPNAVETRYIARLSAANSNTWQKIRLTELNPGSQAAAQAIRFFFRSADNNQDGNADQELAGTVLLGGFSLLLPGPDISSDNNTVVSSGVTQNILLQNAMKTSFPSILDAEATMASIVYQANAGERISIDQNLGERNFDDGSVISWFVYFEDSQVPPSIEEIKISGTDTSFVLQDSINLNPNTWYKFEADLINLTLNVYNNENQLFTQKTLLKHGFSEANIKNVNMLLYFNNSNVGTLYLDHFQMQKPLTRSSGQIDANFSWSRPGILLGTDDFAILQDLAIRQVVNFKSGSYLAPNYTSDIQNNLGFAIDGEYSLTLLYLQAMFGLKINSLFDQAPALLRYALAFPSLAESPIMAKDSFAFDPLALKARYSRANSLDFMLKPYIQSKLETLVSVSEGQLNRNYTVDLALSATNELDLKLKTSISQISLNEVNALDFGAAWAYSWDLLVSNLDEYTFSRSSQFSSGLIAKGRQEQLELKLDLNSDHRLGILVLPKALMSTTLTLGNESSGYIFSAVYSRGIESTLGSRTIDLYNDYTDMFYPLSYLQSYTFGIPFYEFWADDRSDLLKQENAEAGTINWIAQSKFVLTRALDLSPTALILPKAFSLELARRIISESAQIADRWGLQFKSEWRALNLFGTLGSNKSVDFYESDDFSYYFSGSFEWPRQGLQSISIAEGIKLQLVGLQMEGENNKNWKAVKDDITGLLDFGNVASLSFSQDFLYRLDEYESITQRYGLEFTWAADLPPWSPELVGKASVKSAYLINKEQFALQINPESKELVFDRALFVSNTISSQNDGILLTLKHASHLILPGLARISAELGIGYGQDSNGLNSRIGFFARLEAQIKF